MRNRNKAFKGRFFVLAMEEKKRIKMAVIAGASSALSYKGKKPSATESEIINHITRNINEIIEKIDLEE